MSLTYRIAGYDWSQFNWENKQVSYWANTRINHVALRIGPFETFVNQYGAHLRQTRVLEKVYCAPNVLTSPKPLDIDMSDITKLVKGYGPINRPYLYLYNFTGRLLPVPKSCTDLVWQCLRTIGLDVNERFLPTELIKDYYRCT
jgi:hypothetical protein